MSARSGLQMPISILTSKKLLKKPSEKICGVSNSACWEIDNDLSVSTLSYEALPWASLAKNCSWFFQQQVFGAEDLPHAHGQKCLPSKPSNEWISLFQILLSVLLFFSFSLKFNHMHWLCSLKCQLVSI